MISLENQLKKEGFLNKTHEIKEFWDFITVPENLETVLEDGTVLFWLSLSFSSFNNTCTLKLKIQLTVAFVTAVNHITTRTNGPWKEKKLKINGSKSTNHNPRTWPFELLSLYVRTLLNVIDWAEFACYLKTQ